MSAPPVKKQKFQNKKKYFQPKRKQYLEAGHKGFIATCNFNEKDCVRECYNLLNEFADELYGPEEPDSLPIEDVKNAADTVTAKETSDDIADELQKQIDDTQQKAKMCATRRFQCVDTGATNCIFIKTSISDPVSLGENIVKKISEDKKQKTRYLLRLVPVEIVCKANDKVIVDRAGELCDKHFLKEATTFSIVVNKRFNNDVNRDGIIREIADLIHAKNVKHKVDLKNAKKSLVVEVIKGLCCLSVVNDYMAMKKYNLHELARTNPEYETKHADSAKGMEKDIAGKANTESDGKTPNEDEGEDNKDKV